MYERMLNKQEQPQYNEMCMHCKECGELFAGLNTWLMETFATQQEITIGELAQEIIGQINPGAKIICDEQRLRPEKSEVNRLLGSNAKLKELTEWKQRYTFEQGIAETIEWIRQHMDVYKTDIYNI